MAVDFPVCVMRLEGNDILKFTQETGSEVLRPFVPRIASRCWASRARCDCATLPTLNDQKAFQTKALEGMGRKGTMGYFSL